MSALLPAKDRFVEPYKGADSYGPEDSGIFFGRDDEADLVASLVLSNRVSFLYAASGAGKSSLLGARVEPLVEARGWLPIELRLSNQPLVSIRQSLLQQAVLNPALELVWLDELLALPFDRALPLADLPAAFDQLPRAAPGKRQLLRRRAVRVNNGDGVTLPLLARVARGSLPTADYLRALRIVAAHGPSELVADDRISLGALHAVLSQGTLADAHRLLIEELECCPPGFGALIQRFSEIAQQIVDAFPLLLIVDQFEELFTRFADADPTERGAPPPPDRPHWTERRRFIDEINALFGDNAEGALPPSRHPHRLLLSLREDFIAELSALRSIATLQHHNAFRLGFLEKVKAADAIMEPARLFRYRYEPACLDSIINDLLREQRYIEPSHIQIVCERLWQKYARDQVDAVAPGAEPVVISAKQYHELGDASGMLRSYFGEELARLSEGERLEALDMLQPLITTNRTRNIVEKRSLIEAPFRNRALREAALDFLVKRRVVRIERRLQGDFAEITHEFLIKSVLEEIAHMSVADLRLRDAVWVLGRRPHSIDRHGRPATLMVHEFELVDQERERISWDNPSTELMLRSALMHSRSLDSLAFWIRTHARYSSQSVDLLLEGLGTNQYVGPLSRGQWLILATAFNRIPTPMHRSPALLRSALRWCDDDSRQLLRPLLEGASVDG